MQKKQNFVKKELASMRLQFSDLEQLDRIKRAAKIRGMSFSLFVRALGDAVARRILDEPDTGSLGEMLLASAPSSASQHLSPSPAREQPQRSKERGE